MNYRIIQNSSKEILLTQAGEYINKLLTGVPVLLMLSGGSASDILDKIDSSRIDSNVTITVLDERYSVDSSINNFSQIVQTLFYKNAVKQNAEFIDTRVIDQETQSQLTERFEHSLRNWKTAHPTGLIIATQGIGPDGHTSGILPFPESESTFNSLFCGENWVVGYDAKEKNQYPLRITTTITFMKMIDHSVVYATGENKKAVLQKAFSVSSELHEVPSKVIQDMKDVVIYTDQQI
jgi:6-phosphogluconolactonase/glucosamine-6-phosphate isomerase/deaminase